MREFGINYSCLHLSICIHFDLLLSPPPFFFFFWRVKVITNTEGKKTYLLAVTTDDFIYIGKLCSKIFLIFLDIFDE